ncbi:MFS transporter [Oceanobacillus piezotolerans]|uniref:MFS transporter n=1 Tax=Oceanobacillus piezotolerans TaxID=2448030 RepID=A0A498D7Q1_9BACI|nr:MFS transporter [Oceanobacillus piezotolerans]RLL44877.1 MFS transporter [Oceanobacillus piezotolerans]
MGKPKLWTKDFIMVSTSNFLLFVSFYMLMVTLAVYSINQFQASQSEAGLASSIFVLGAVLVRPIAGKFIENVGKKKLLLFGLALFLGMMLLYFPINHLGLLLVIRFIHGFAFGISTTATGTIAADIIPMARRGEGMGYFATSMNLAMAIGPFIGLILSRYFEDSMIFVTTTVFSVIAFIATLFLRVPEEESVKAKTEGPGFRLKDYFEKTTIPIGIFIMICGFVYSSILSFLTSYATEINLVDAASFFFVMYAIFLLLSRPFTGKLFDSKGENMVIYPSILLLGVGLILLSQAHAGWILLLAGAIIGVGFGTLQSSAQTVAVNLAERNRIGLATSTFFVFYDFGIGVGPFLLGFILPYIEFRGLYLMMAIIAFLSIIVYYFAHGKKRTKNGSSTEKLTYEKDVVS